MHITPIANEASEVDVQVEACFACGEGHTTPLLRMEYPVSTASTTFVFRYLCPSGANVLVWLPPDPRSGVVCHLAQAPESGLVGKR